MESAIKLGDVVLDNYGREGIVVREEPSPPQGWLMSQADERLHRLGHSERWLGILPFTGGLVLSPESLTERLRAAQREDLLRAVETANSHGVRYLVELFPTLAGDALGSDHDGPI